MWTDNEYERVTCECIADHRKFFFLCTKSKVFIFQETKWLCVGSQGKDVYKLLIIL